MERVRRLAQFWNWLPAFRAVAECEHLPTASQKLGVTAPALSRMIKLIEADLEVELFSRTPGRLVLNPAGRRFLVHIRDAMRWIDEGMQDLKQLSYCGPVRISASTATASVLVLPAMERIPGLYPELVAELVSLPEEEVSLALRTGDLDLAILEYGEADGDLAAEQLTTMTYSVYCGRSHPLTERDAIDLDAVLEHPFVGPGPGAHDSWPRNLRRTVTARITSLSPAVELCARSRLLALLPDAVAQQRDDLHRLPLEPLATTPIFAAFRRPLGGRDRVTVVLELIRAAADDGAGDQDARAAR